MGATLRTATGWIEAAREACTAAERDGMLSDRGRGVLSGFSGEKLIGTLQRLVGLTCNDTRAYVEVGVFQGLTLLSVASAHPEVMCVGIDNYSQCDPEGKNEAVVHERVANLGLSNVALVNDDFERALVNAEGWLEGRSIGVCFIDGPHDYRAQLIGLLYVERFLSERCVMVVDDANYPHVRQATADFLNARPEFALLMQAYTPAHPSNMTPDQKASAVKGWWNGVNVIVRDPERRLERRFPPVSHQGLHAMTHNAFGMEFAELGYEALRLCHAMAGGSKARTEAELSTLMPAMKAHREGNPGRFYQMNTYSAGLTAFDVAEAE